MQGIAPALIDPSLRNSPTAGAHNPNYDSVGPGPRKASESRDGAPSYFLSSDSRTSCFTFARHSTSGTPLASASAA
jgi:hypothetical protein